MLVVTALLKEELVEAEPEQSVVMQVVIRAVLVVQE
jgi:hypothetical protein|tara:strand:+ start:136 stop:243 length:108 start_codon:yes stop_codon:yes gene_type:complete